MDFAFRFMLNFFLILVPLQACLAASGNYSDELIASIDSNGLRAALARTDDGRICSEKFCYAGQDCHYRWGFPYCDTYSAKVGATCDDNPCEHGGTCQPGGVNNYRCDCPADVYGYSCQTGSTLCTGVFCANGGTCVTVSGGGARCFCPSAYAGDDCTKPCTLPCQNGAACQYDQTGAQTCIKCPKGYTGPFCEVAPCDRYTCLNGGTCVNDGTQPLAYRCEPTTKVRNETACSSNPCLGPNCQCFESCKHEHGYYCMSQQGYIGQNCDIGPPTLTCHHDKIELEVSAGFYDEYDDTKTSFMYFSSTVDGFKSVQACQAQPINGKYRLTINPPFTTSCGTTRTQALNSHTYKNTLWINRRTGSSLYDMPFPALDWTCTFNYDLDVVASLQPVVDNQRPSLPRVNSFDASVSLCKISTCQQSCPSDLVVGAGAVYTVSETIHLSVNFNIATSIFSASPFTDIASAFLSCSPDTSSAKDTVELSSTGTGCNYNSALDVRAGASSSQHAACMSFKVPRFHQCTTIYIHLRLRICSSADVTTSICSSNERVQHCPARLTKRSLSDKDADVAYHVIGPITIVDSGVEAMTFLSDSETSVTVGNVSDTGVMLGSHSPVYGGLGLEMVVLSSFTAFFVLLTIVMFFSLLFLRHKRSMK
ncbi:unnamed protein product [Clavelina lepadiformis]|uniref:Uncharacterized protein n=1 Tax=Clavelina lepadiformis TaxID=159417 RepID=A0ABP0GQK9_CLALP